jgi:hypothetical protein
MTPQSQLGKAAERKTIVFHSKEYSRSDRRTPDGEVTHLRLRIGVVVHIGRGNMMLLLLTCFVLLYPIAPAAAIRIFETENRSRKRDSRSRRSHSE